MFVVLRVYTTEWRQQVEQTAAGDCEEDESMMWCVCVHQVSLFFRDLKKQEKELPVH